MAALITPPFARLHPALSSLGDPELNDIIVIASAAVEKWCSRLFARATLTEKYDGDNTKKLLLNQYPVNSITSIEITYQGVTDTDTLTTEFDFKDNGIVVIKKIEPYVFVRGFQNIEVVYNAGYDVLPADLAMGVRLMAVYIYEDADRSADLIEERLGDWKARYANKANEQQDFPVNITRWLRKYKKQVIFGGAKSGI